MTLLTVVRDVCAAVGVQLPTSIFAALNSNRTMQEMVALANEMAQRICYDTRDWTTLRLTASFTNNFALWANGTAYAVDDDVTDPDNGSSWRAAVAHTSASSGTFAEDRSAAGHVGYWISSPQIAFNLPADYKRMLLTSNVRSGAQPNQPLSFIPDYDQWIERRLSAATDNAWGEWTMSGGRFLVSPPPRGFTPAKVGPPVVAAVAATPITFPYMDRNCVALASGGYGDRFMADTDSFRLDERLLKLGMVWQWKAQKGSPYAEDMGTYSDALASASGRDSPAPIIVGRQPLSANARVAYPWPVPT